MESCTHTTGQAPTRADYKKTLIKPSGAASRSIPESSQGTSAASATRAPVYGRAMALPRSSEVEAVVEEQFL
jgi:hypothetical protein